MKAKYFLMMLVLSVFILTACSSFKTNAYKTLDISASIYESGYPAFLGLHKQGLITDEQKQKGYDIAVKYWSAYHSAQLLLESYATVDSAENKGKLKLALDELADCLKLLTEYIQPFILEE